LSPETRTATNDQSRNNEFEQTTEDNVYVKDGILYIGATLQDQTLMENPTLINLTADGTCTSSTASDCVAITNLTTSTIVPPVLSGRINTKASVNIKYGRVEVTAKLPKGDWLWPAIWMLPVNDTYGSWPRSGEIDVMESRGNNHTYPLGGDSRISSTLHFGPNTENDAWDQATAQASAQHIHRTYSDDFHVFGVEWSQDYIYTYIDTRLTQNLYLPFSRTFWSRGNFPSYDQNYIKLTNPWPAGNDIAPYDQKFYLILNLAVGGTNGWFPDAMADKPWQDVNGINARTSFWQAESQWGPTWTQPTLQIKKVEIWQQDDGNEEL
jgi:beta-glucanase (GH16 family)